MTIYYFVFVVAMDIDPLTQDTPEDDILCGAVAAMLASTSTQIAPEDESMCGGTVGAMMASTPMQSLRWDSGKRTAVKAAGGLQQNVEQTRHVGR
mgnify:CR=1 FL=1